MSAELEAIVDKLAKEAQRGTLPRKVLPKPQPLQGPPQNSLSAAPKGEKTHFVFTNYIYFFAPRGIFKAFLSCSHLLKRQTPVFASSNKIHFCRSFPPSAKNTFSPERLLFDEAIQLRRLWRRRVPQGLRAGHARERGRRRGVVVEAGAQPGHIRHTCRCVQYQTGIIFLWRNRFHIRSSTYYKSYFSHLQHISKLSRAFSFYNTTSHFLSAFF